MSAAAQELQFAAEQELAVTDIEPAILEGIVADGPDRKERMQALSVQFGRQLVALMQAADVRVVDVVSCQKAKDLRVTIGAMVKEIEAYYEPRKAQYYDPWKKECAEETALIAQLLDKRQSTRNPNTIDGKLCLSIQAFLDEQDKLEREAARKRQEEEERQSQALKRQADDRALVEAAALRDHGHAELADAVIEEQALAPAPLVSLPAPPTAKQQAGVQTKRVWKWHFVGGPKAKKDILKETPPEILAQAKTRMNREDLMPDVKVLDAKASALMASAKIPFVTVYYEDVPIR